MVDPSRIDDEYLWKIGGDQPSSKFSTSATWHFLNPPGSVVEWHQSIWFKGRIPKHAFIAWVAARHRLHTRDRLISWGILVPPSCLLCSSHDESLQHLFFDCSFSNEVWSFSHLRFRSPHQYYLTMFLDGLKTLLATRTFASF